MGVDSKSDDKETEPIVEPSTPEKTGEDGTEEKSADAENGQPLTQTEVTDVEAPATTKDVYQPLLTRKPFLLRCLILLLVIFVILVFVALIVLIVIPALTKYYTPPMHETVLRVARDLQYFAPFDKPRNLTIPKGFEIEAYASVASARNLLALPNGDVLVSQPKEGKITLLKAPPTQDMSAIRAEFVTDLKSPHDMAFYTDENGNHYIYVAEETQVARYIYKNEDTKIGSQEIVVTNLPYHNTDENPFKGIAVGNDSLYVSIGSASDSNPNELQEYPKRGAIYGYRPQGGQGRLVTEGVRSAEGLAFFPGTNDLWAVVKQRKKIKYPFKGQKHNTVDPVFVDFNPPEEFSRIVEGENYGWPYCNPNVKISKGRDVKYVADVETNAEEAINCRDFRKIDMALPPHTVPLGLAFWAGENVPTDYKNGALVTLNAFNRKTDEGNSLIFVPWDYGKPVYHYTLVSGWIVDPETNEKWGNPVDTAVLGDGSILISDSMYGAIYRLYKQD